MPSEERTKTWVEWKARFEKEIIKDLKEWFRAPRKLGDQYTVTFDPCGGCAKYGEWCEMHLDECKGQYWQPRED